MKYKEAVELCRGQEFAMEMPLKALPQARPHPDQETDIWCKAPIVPQKASIWEGYPDREHVEIYISYKPKPDAKCRLTVPDCANCHVASAAREAQGGQVTLTREQHKRNDLSAFKLNV